MLIEMKTPIVEIDGDEMTRIIWREIKKELIEPYVSLKTEYYDLGIENRDHTDDRVTQEAGAAIRRLGVGVKCATITPNAQRVAEFGLKKMWRSPNGTIRAMLDGTVFRTPILVRNIKAAVRTWDKPITIARHAFGDVYSASEMRISAPGKAKLLYSEDGKTTERDIHSFKGPGVLTGMFNTDESITSFAKSCFAYALSTGQDLWFSTKDTISKLYDHRFKDIFEELYENEYKELFAARGIGYYYMLIDDAVARVIRSRGGFVWALKNYDGDVMSDMIAMAFGALAMMTSVLVSPYGCFEFEAAHGTVTRHYYRHLRGEKTSTNCMATLFAWTGALNKRGEMDNTPALARFAGDLERAAKETIESGIMTGDLAALCEGESRVVDTNAFIAEIRKRYDTISRGEE